MSDPGLQAGACPAAAPTSTPSSVGSRGATRSAFEALYDELSSAVFGLARRVVRDPARAEDVTQEVFLEVWRKAPRFDSALGTAKTWVMTIAHRRAVDAVRRNEAQKRQDEHGAHRRGQPRRAGRPGDRGRGARRGPRLPGDADRPAARVGPAGLLQRLHLHRGGDPARQAASHDQDPDEGRPDPSARLPGGAHDEHRPAHPLGCLRPRRAERRGGRGVPHATSRVPGLPRRGPRAAGGRGRDGRQPRRSRPPRALRARVLAAADQHAAAAAQGHAARARRRHAAGRRGSLVAAAAVVVGRRRGLRGQPAAGRRPAARFAAAAGQVFAAPDAHTETVETDQRRQLTVATSPSRGRMAVDTAACPSWTSRQSTRSGRSTTARPPRPGCSRTRGRQGDGHAGAGTTVAITVEPAGGSTQPTSEPIVTVDPTQRSDRRQRRVCGRGRSSSQHGLRRVVPAEAADRAAAAGAGAAEQHVGHVGRDAPLLGGGVEAAAVRRPRATRGRRGRCGRRASPGPPRRPAAPSPRGTGRRRSSATQSTRAAPRGARRSRRGRAVRPRRAGRSVPENSRAGMCRPK